MDPEKFLTVDTRVVKTMQVVACILSCLIGVVLVLLGLQKINLTGNVVVLDIPLSVIFLVMGPIFLLWNPLTLKKFRSYIFIYSAAVLPLSVGVFGYRPFMMICWLCVLTAVSMFLSARATLYESIIMLVGMVIWLALPAQHDFVRSGAEIGQLLIFLVAGSYLVLNILNLTRTTSKTVNDLTESQEKESLERQRLLGVINSMTDGAIAVDGQGKVVFYNAAALNLLDRNENLEGVPLGQALKPLDAEEHEVDVNRLLKEAKTPTVNRELRLRYDTDNSLINLYLSISPVHMGFGKGDAQQGFILLMRDITREKSLEEERDEFISVVSHELRTPIAISEGNISNAEFIVNKEQGSDSIKQALKEAHHQVLFLADMINDLATLSRAERGKLQVEVEPINVHELMQELASNYTPEAQAKGLEVKLELDPKLELLYSSKLYVREVLQNFITNAVKYTDEGFVTLHASADPRGVRFGVEDTGIGISKGDQERIFDKFFRSEDFRTRKANGTGLGLYVTMKLANLIHAEIDVQSILNQGSLFSIFIPNWNPDGSGLAGDTKPAAKEKPAAKAEHPSKANRPLTKL